MNKRHQNVAHQRPPRNAKSGAGAQSANGAVDEPQFCLSFGEPSEPRAPAAAPARAQSHAGTSAVSHLSIQFAPERTNAPRQHSEDQGSRSLDGPTSHNPQSLDASRAVPAKAKSSRTVRGLASIGRRTLAVRRLDGEPQAEPIPERLADRGTQPVLLLRLREVRQATGLSRNSIYRLEAAGQFPSRVQLSSKSVAWRESQISEWVRSRPSGRPLRDGRGRKGTAPAISAKPPTPTKNGRP